MENSPQKRLEEHIRKLEQLEIDVRNETITCEDAKVRLDALKMEQNQLENVSMTINRYADGRDNMMRRFTKRSRTTSHATHELDFKCQCARCVRMHTITLADRDLLKEMKIVWERPKLKWKLLPKNIPVRAVLKGWGSGSTLFYVVRYCDVRTLS